MYNLDIICFVVKNADNLHVERFALKLNKKNICE